MVLVIGAKIEKVFWDGGGLRLGRVGRPESFYRLRARQFYLTILEA